MKHTLNQAKSAKKNLINHHQYKETDFLETDDDVICINSEDLEFSAYDVLKERELALKEKRESVFDDPFPNFFGENKNK